MLNLFKLNKVKIKHAFKKIKSAKHFPISSREWNNSIYVYNKNTLNLLPITYNSAISLIKTYFTLFNNNIERKLRTKRLLFRFKRLSSNKIYVSNGEFKHFNNKIIITLYIFNRQKNKFLLSIKNWYIKNLLGNKILNINKDITFEKYIFKSFKSISNKSLLALKKTNSGKNLLVKKLDAKNNRFIFIFVNSFYKRLLRKWYVKLQLYFYYRQLIFINKTMFNYNYLQHLKIYLEKLYNKNVEFNMVNMKRFYLNSDILTESITLKITKNRRKMSIYLDKFKNKIKLQKKNINILEKLTVNKRNLNKRKYLSINKNSLKTDFLNNLKYKYVTGFRLEAKGRLTRRHSASRSLQKVIYTGNLLETDSTYKGLSTVLLKGNMKSNLQFSKLSSKSRIGSFGIKGWLSGN